jgi:hypothetical protein
MHNSGVVGERQSLSSPALAAVSISDSDARAALFQVGKNKCGDCRHLRLLHVENKCSLCGCIAKSRPGNSSVLKIREVYAAVAEGAKYHPEGIALTRLIFVVSRHNRAVYDYFQIAKYGHKVWGIFPAQNYKSVSNGRYQRFRIAVIEGKVPELSVRTLIPTCTVFYNGEGFE